MAKIDPITFEVVRHKLWQATDEMAATLKLVSSSPIVTEVNDFCTAICTKEGKLAAMGTYMTAFAWAIRTAIQNTIAETGTQEIDDGDMLILNDPWRGCLHQSDTAIVAPIFYKGELVCWAGSMAHQLDIGALSPGGFNPGAVEVYQEGLRLPPVKLVEGGKLRSDIFNMIMNMVRSPQVALDLKGQIATNNTCKERLVKLCERYGVETVRYVMNRQIRSSESRFKKRLRELPDGVFRHTDYVDHDGHSRRLFKVCLTMGKKDDAIDFDFAGTSDQASGFINCTLSGTWGGVVGAINPWLCYDMDWNEGLLKPLTVRAPEGTFINARIPAPVSFTTVGPMNVVRNAAEICISKLIGCSEKYAKGAMAVWLGAEPKVLLGGVNQFGERFAYSLMDNLTGGGGARAAQDGVDSGGESASSDVTVPNIETHEASYPLLFLFRRQTRDSFGDGEYRGGVGCEEMFIPYDTNEMELTLASRGVDVPNSVGVFGGYPANVNEAIVVIDSDTRRKLRDGIIPSSVKEIAGKALVLPACVHRRSLKRDDLFYYRWVGGGGYGDPLERDPGLVLTDLKRGLISPGKAAAVYGLVLNRNGTLDLEKTRMKRKEIRARRLGRTGKLGLPERKSGRLLPLGKYLGASRSKGDVECTNCGHRYCRLNQNPKKYARVIENLIEHAKFDTGEQLVQREYLCPRCATVFSVDICEKGAPPLFDIELG